MKLTEVPEAYFLAMTERVETPSYFSGNDEGDEITLLLEMKSLLEEHITLLGGLE